MIRKFIAINSDVGAVDELINLLFEELIVVNRRAEGGSFFMATPPLSAIIFNLIRCKV